MKFLVIPQLKLYNKSSCSHFSTATGKDFGTWVIILIQAVRCFRGVCGRRFILTKVVLSGK